MRVSRWLLPTLVLVACSPSAVVAPNGFTDAATDNGATDAPTTQDVPKVADVPALDVPAADVPAADVPAADVPVVTDVPAVDVPPTPCTSNRQCSGAGVCDRLTSRCVQCVTASDCGGVTPVCIGHRCVAATACVSSRTCVGQVCDTSAGRCVECVVDVDCPMGSVCRGSSCVAPPAPCMSSRTCSALDQVCDTGRGVCVDCAGDVDCASGQFCTAERTCAAQRCVPNSATCADPRTRRVCAANGGGTTDTPCAAGTSCRDGACVAQVCIPGSATCASTTARQVCDADGFGYTPAACAAGPNATPACSAGACRLSCMTGFGDCDGDAANGCEANLGTSVGSCGSCSRVCAAINGSPSCAGGACAITCAAGFGDCDGSLVTGCETSVQASAQHCGGCGRACPGLGAANTTAACTAGTCTFSCAMGYADCDAVTANGCETSVRASAQHCGGCGRACAAGQACAAGACIADVPIPALPTARNGLGVAVTADGTLYAIGGATSSTSASTLVEAWTAATGRWTARAPLPLGAWNPGVTVGIDGRVYVVGGRNASSAAMSNAWVYDATGNAWTAIASLGTPRHSHAIATDRTGRIFAISGRTGTGTVTGVVEFLDPTTMRWSSFAALPTAVSSSRATTAPDGSIWVFGGVTLSGSTIATTQVLSAGGAAWTSGPAVPDARFSMGVTTLGGLIYLFGGDSDTAGTSRGGWSLSPSTRSYAPLSPMPVGRLYFGLGALTDGRLVAVGGSSNSSSSYLSTVNTYVPSTNTWR